MKRTTLLLITLISCLLTAKATHIVGGGFSYSRVSNDTYRFNLTLYFDYINGNSGAKDSFATCHLFQKSNNIYLDSIDLPLVDSSRFLPFSNPRCGTRVNLKTQVLQYSRLIQVNPAFFDDPQGYYLIWERCCRNNVISNINAPEATGQTFYMEFPPMTINGQSINNNSPVFDLISSDYPCINIPFQLPFGATDSNGDSLVYSLTNPIKGNSTPARPRGTPPFPAPYDPVSWKFGYSALNPLNGLPGLKVNPKTGLLTCTATQTGLYVFSVKCEEFRNGKKIGEIRREMQITVIDCPANSQPEIVIRSDAGSLLADDDTLYFTGGPQGSCREIKLVDKQRNEPLSYELIRISNNSPASLSTIKNLVIGSTSDSVTATFCIPGCSVATPQDPWKVLFVATDNGCSLPKKDSLYLFLVVTPIPGNPPNISTTTPQPDTIEVVQTGSISLPLEAIQNQNGVLTIRSTLVDVNGNPVTGNGLTLPSGSGRGVVNATFKWTEICTTPDQLPLRLQSIVESNVCGDIQFDTFFIYIRVIPKLLDVTLTSSYTGATDIFLDERTSTRFLLTGKVNDSRTVQLSASGSLKDQPDFIFRGGVGTTEYSDNFYFTAACGGKSGTYPVTFMAVSRFCGFEYIDSLRYNVTLKYEPDSMGILPNLITPNGDGMNDEFSLAKIAPVENCANQFDFVEIYNRWGKRIFFSRNRDFVWSPEKDIEGIYYYGLNFKNKRFSSWISVVH